MARIIASSNAKGGAGKTTTVLTLGAVLAELGQRVLLVDVDGQGNLSEGFGLQAMRLERDLSGVFTDQYDLSDIILSLRPNLDLAPGNLNLATIEPWLITEMGRETKLTNALASVQDDYDFVLIDCPPSVGIYTVNAFRASSEVIIPVTAEFYALIGVSMLLSALQRVREGLKHEVSVTGIIPTRMTRTNNAREVLEQIETQLGETYRVFAPIPEAVAVRNAATQGVPVTEAYPDSPASEAYRKLAQEVLNES